MEVFKETHVMFQAERVGKMYMLRNSEVTVGGLQLSSISEAVVMEQSEIMVDWSSDVQFYLEERLGLDVQWVSPDRYSYGGANSYRSCIDQGDRWAIEFRLGLTLFDLIKLWTPWGGYEEEGVGWYEVKFVQLCVDASTWNMVAILRLGLIQVKREIVKIITWIRREYWLVSDLVASFSGSVLSPSWIQVSFILIEGGLSPSWI